MKIPDIELMLYTDGELDEERARRVRVARLTELEVGARLEGIEQVGSFVRAWAAKAGVDPRAERRRAERAAARRRLVGTVAAAVVALVAVTEPRAPSGVREVALASPSRDFAASQGPAVAIELVDFGSHPGTVFVVEAGGSTTPVVWLADDAKAGG
jgi:hypothetical protein